MRSLSPAARAILTSWRALRRVEQHLARLGKARALTGHRNWARDRKARTRWLIEYGGLVAKAGLVDRLQDDRATFYGALLMLRDLLDGAGTDMPADLKLRWRRRGLRAFDADAAAKAESKAGNREGRADGEAPMPSG